LDLQHIYKYLPLRVLLAVSVMLCVFPATLDAASNTQMVQQSEDVQDKPGTQDAFPYVPQYKDPFIAGVLSWSWTGLGQFYAQDYAKGSLFLVADMSQKGLFLYMLFHLSDKYQSNDEIISWTEMSTQDRGVILGLAFSILVTKVLCVIDAVDSASDYNREVYYPYWRQKQNIDISYNPDAGNVNLSVKRRFSF
jgi:TM2 domain-containing membrane protein YozV